jgi:hypothetical protein
MRSGFDFGIMGVPPVDERGNQVFVSPLRPHMTADKVLEIWREVSGQLGIKRKGYEIESPYQRRPLKRAVREH